MEITHDAEPNFSNARTLHFRELIDREDANVHLDGHSIGNNIFDAVYGVTTVKG